jgi:hypothetical protein
MQTLDGVGGARRLPLFDGQPREREEPVAGFLQAGGDGFALVAPFADEGLAPLLDGLWTVRIDNVGIVGRNLLGEPFRCVRDQVPELVHRAALQGQSGPQRDERLLQSGRAVDDGELGRLEAAPCQVVENAAPGCLAPAALPTSRRPCS